MVDALIALIVAVIIIGIIVYVLRLVLDLIPMDDRFRQIAWVLILLVAALVILVKALPMLGMSSPV